MDRYSLDAQRDNPLYMGKVAYSRQRTEKKTGIRNEMYIVEQSEFSVYNSSHEAVISQLNWQSARKSGRTMCINGKSYMILFMRIFCQAC